MFLLRLLVLALSLCLVTRVTSKGVAASPSGAGTRIPYSDQSMVDTCRELQQEAQTIRREGYLAVDKADQIREQAYRVKDEAYGLKDEAYDIKESAYDARSALESTMVETLALMRSQGTATNLYIQEIRSTLSSMTSRMDRLQGMIEELDDKVEERSLVLEEQTTALGEKLNEIEQTVNERSTMLEEKVDLKTSAVEEKVEGSTRIISSKVSETLAAAQKIKERQETWMSEIRLISLYKVTEETNRNPNGYNSDLIADGQFIFDSHTHSSMRTYSHSIGTGPNNKLWIELGGVFRIHKIKIWNLRHCCQERLVGAHLYADERLIGTVIQATATYDFTVNAGDPVYASRVTLHQPLATQLHILELQVWGNGPVQLDDLFA